MKLEIYGPAHEILVLIKFSNSERSGESAQMSRTARAFDDFIHKVGM